MLSALSPAILLKTTAAAPERQSMNDIVRDTRTIRTKGVRMPLLSVALGVFLIAAAVHVIAAQKPAGADATQTAVAAANTFLATLDESQRAKANIAFTSQSRAIWSNLPTGITLHTGATEANGLNLADTAPAQEKAALALLASVLSRDGYTKAMQIVDADQVLETRSAATRGATSRIRFGRGEFYIAILGKPAAADR